MQNLGFDVTAYPEMHPQSMSFQEDLDHFGFKVEQGANSTITPYFYSAHAYFDFLERVQKAGISIPVGAGIMPITNSS